MFQANVRIISFCGAMAVVACTTIACAGATPEVASPRGADGVDGADPASLAQGELAAAGARYLLALPLASQASPPNDGRATSEPPPDPGVRSGALTPEAASAPAPEPVKEKSSLLPSGFYNPMPGGVFAGYRADTGLDIAGSPRPVYAIQSGTLDYSEPGHTLWTGPGDTANCVRFKLDVPIPWKGRKITHVWYAHLSKLEYEQPEGAPSPRRIEAGERLGVSGVANHSPHLHIGMLLDGEVEQYWGTFLIEDEVRQVLGGYRNGTRLPRE